MNKSEIVELIHEKLEEMLKSEFEMIPANVRQAFAEDFATLMDEEIVLEDESDDW